MTECLLVTSASVLRAQDRGFIWVSVTAETLPPRLLRPQGSETRLQKSHPHRGLDSSGAHFAGRCCSGVLTRGLHSLPASLSPHSFHHQVTTVLPSLHQSTPTTVSSGVGWPFLCSLTAAVMDLAWLECSRKDTLDIKELGCFLSRKAR